MLELTAKTFRDFVKQKFVVVEFYSDYCLYCRAVLNVLALTCSELGVKAGKLNVLKYPSIAREYEVELLPTVIAFSRGEAVGGFMGYADRKAIRAEIKRLAAEYG